MTGDTAKKSGLKNFHNAFTKIYEARYLSGVAAGLKLKELIEEKVKELKDLLDNPPFDIKIKL